MKISLYRKCHLIPLCFKCANHDQFECDFLSKLDIPKNFFIQHFDVITPLRFFILSKNKERAESFMQVMEMESHCDKRRGTNIWKMHEANVYQPLKKLALFQHDESFINDFVQKMCGILDVNTFEVRTPRFEVSISQ